jgi:hypothetical protein
MPGRIPSWDETYSSPVEALRICFPGVRREEVGVRIGWRRIGFIVMLHFNGPR